MRIDMREYLDMSELPYSSLEAEIVLVAIQKANKG
jgi:hypothetical protein